jgi:HK97 family phage portal protein
MFLTSPRADGFMDRSPWGGFFFNPVGVLTRSGTHVTPGSALALPTVFACVSVLAKSFASMPFVLYQAKRGGGRTKNSQHWLYRLMAKAPNRFQTPYEWRLMLQGHLALRGNAFCQITANGAGEITELLPLHPDRMTVEILDSGDYRYHYIDQNGKSIYYQRGEIWHLRGLSNDGYVGLSPIEAAREIIGEGLAMQSYSSRFFANDAQPAGGWIEYPGGFATKEARAVFREDWQALQGGPNRGKIAVLENGMKFHEVGLNNKDSQFIEARGLNARQVAQAFGVPPHKVNILDNATFSNIEQQSIEFWTDTMLPFAELWESSLEYFLLGPDDTSGLDPEFDMRRMMRGDSTARSAYYNQGINSGWLTRNEAREAEGYDPIDGLDEPLRPLNMVEESQASDEMAEVGGSDDDHAQPADDADAASVRRNRRREARRAAKSMREALTAAANERVAALLDANASRLARRAAGSLGKKSVDEVFDTDFAALLVEGLCVSEARANTYCMKLRGAEHLSEQQIQRTLLACASGA